ncbi:pyridoxamine 5'-phosphate oxidase family protein [Mycobacterium camsae]|uniref:pyridoxamine 5'-phosphate oxidase family protein n=1 Tax=Mycobacterium gordonae TaxID=1778 RepID=UPI001F11F939|nr:pyridoxamine 5'-phosphate oxidase family protein [Mycobacterium gordonae]
MSHRAAAVGFHTGELAVQRQAGVQDAAARLAPMVADGELRAGASAFLAKANFAALSARDAAGRLWISPLVGDPGFLQVVSPTRLLIATTPPAADPLRELPGNQPVGLVVMDFSTRRRLRINGMLSTADSGALAIDVDQAYGNCPQYIHPRQLRRHSGDSQLNMFHGNVLRPQDIELVHAADTFFLGTTHPESGNDASHRGGPAGFVRVVSGRLSWPDYPGNNMFNSFGNLFSDPTAALLFVDFDSGATLQLSGTATLRWDVDATATGRCVVFTPQEVVASGSLA